MKTIGFIGGGRITNIFLQAYQNRRMTFEKIVVMDINPERLSALKLKFPKITTTENLQEVVKNEVVFIALHPPAVIDTLTKLNKDELSSFSVIVSLAPKLTIEKISTALKGFANIARLNPSASSIVMKGVNPITFSDEMSSEIKNNLMKLLQPLGFTPVVNESKIEAYAVIIAMGHTYFFFQLQRLKELAVTFGMNEEEAQTAISEMLRGTTETLFNSGLQYNEVADLVPVKPMGEVEETIKGYYDYYLTNIFNKIKP
jgi:pyrroline-5-carboxylate reductase